MKLLKQRFSIWYNRVHRRFGTLWAERFKSVLLEYGESLLRCMAYVDRNSVRARICQDPKDYRFGGYSEALAGNLRARRGIMLAVGCSVWSEAHAHYRARVLAGLPGAPADGTLAVGTTTTLARRCRYFTDGAVLGTKAFVVTQISEFRRRTGRGSRTEPRAVPDLGADLAIMRRLSSFPSAG